MYMLTSPRGFRYVGKTVLKLHRRFQFHVRKALYDGADTPLAEEIRTYSAESFAFTTLIVGYWNRTEAAEEERFQIKTLQPELNVIHATRT